MYNNFQLDVEVAVLGEGMGVQKSETPDIWGLPKKVALE